MQRRATSHRPGTRASSPLRCATPTCPADCKGNCEAGDDGSLRCASASSNTTLTLGLAIAGAALGLGMCLLVVAFLARSSSDLAQGGVGELWLRRRWRGAHTSSRVHSLPVHVPARKGPPDAPKLTSSTGIAQWA